MMIAYIFPSRSRPAKFFKTLDNIKIFSESDNYFVWAKLDEDDETMNNPEVIEKIKAEHPEVTVKWGISESKVHAVNRSLEDLPECDILIIQSDDIVWDMVGYDNEIRNAFEKHFPGLDGTVHFPEENAARRTIIVSMVGINLYRKLGYLYHPDFVSVYCDNHFTEMTMAMKKYVYIDKTIFSHHHPIWQKTDWDELYRLNEGAELYKKDRDTFTRLKANNFGL